MRGTSYLVTIRGEFASLNEWVDANRTRNGAWSKGNSMKQADQKRIIRQLPKIRINKQISLQYTFYCRNKRKDKDNVCGYFHKIFQDSLVKAGIIKNDGWDDIFDFHDAFQIDREDPRIEVEIEVIG